MININVFAQKDIFGVQITAYTRPVLEGRFGQALNAFAL